MMTVIAELGREKIPEAMSVVKRYRLANRVGDLSKFIFQVLLLGDLGRGRAQGRSRPVLAVDEFKQTQLKLNVDL